MKKATLLKSIQAMVFLAFLLVTGALSAQTTIYSEPFTAANGTSSSTKWVVNLDNCSFGSGQSLNVQSNKLTARGTQCDALWYTSPINISKFTNVGFTVDISEAGDLESDDYISFIYQIDGGAYQYGAVNGTKTDDFNSAVVSQTGLTGSSLIIGFMARNSASDEYYYIDNVTVTGTPKSNFTVSLANVDVKCNGASTGTITTTVTPGAIPNTVTTPFACTSCTQTISGSTAKTISSGQKYCITSSYTGAITMNGGTLVVCGTANPSSITWNSGEIINNGTLTVSALRAPDFMSLKNYGTLNVSGTLECDGFFYNFGNATAGILKNDNPGFMVNTGTINVTGSFTNADNLANSGTINVAGTITNSGGFIDNDYIINASTFTNSGWFENAGTFTVDNTTTFNSSSVVTLSPASKIVTDNFSMRGSITNTSTSSCALISIAGNSTLYSSATVSGKISICDADGVENNYGPSLSNNAAINCSCSTNSSFTYAWSGGGTTQNKTGLAAGTYTVTVTSGGSTVSASATITQPAVLAATITGTNINCFGNTTGAVTLAPSGGTTPYKYVWSNGATTQNLSNKAIGTYSVTITDANNCTLAKSVTLTQPSATLAANISGTNPTTVGGSNGSVTLATPTGGTSPYTYVWSTGATTQNLTSRPAGTYTVTITDNKGCTITRSQILTAPSGLTLTHTATNISCRSGSNGAIDLSVSGGSGYTYIWSSGATTQDITGRAAGTYTVTVTATGGVTATRSVTLTQPAASLSAVATGSNPSCSGGADGSADLVPAGGTSPYTYAWSGGGGTSQDLNARAAGTYTVTVTDALGCTTTTSVTLSQPSGITVAMSNTNTTCGWCSNGTVTATPSGGTAPYTYVWNGGATSQTKTGASISTHSVTVTDSRGCTATASRAVNAPLTVSIAGQSACSSGSTGSAIANASGGNSPYSYLWAGGSTSQTRTGLASGTYTLTVTDALGATASQSVNISNTNVVISGGTGATMCKGQTAQLQASGGTVYSWTPTTGLSNPNIANPVANPTVTTTYTISGGANSAELITNGSFTNGNTGFTSAYQYVSPASNSGSGLVPEGYYAVDANANAYHSNFFGVDHSGSGKFLIVNGAVIAGQAVWQQTITVTPNTNYNFSTWITSLNTGNPALLNFSINGVELGADINAPSTLNNWSQFSTQWNSGANTSAVIAIINNNTVPSGNDFGLDDISFTTLCNSGSSGTVTVTINTPVPNAGPDQSTCAGATTSLSATGGTSYAWSTGGTTATINVSPVSTTTYTVTVTNSTGCTASDDVIVNTNGTGPGDPAVFGNNLWRVYAWNAGNASGTNGAWTTNYSGYYSINSLNFDTRTGQTYSTPESWDPNSSPSSALGYQGCVVSNDNHSYAFKRQGFLCGYYVINLPNHDDYVSLYVNGVLAYSFNGCCATRSSIWSGYLGSSSTLELRISEGGGGSHGSIELVKQNDVTVTGIAVRNLCGNGSATLTATASAGCSVNWYAASSGGSVLSGGSNTNTYTTPSISTATTYYAQATEATSGCVSSRTAVTATPPSASLSGSVAGTNPTTSGGTNGSANLTVTGGTSPYTYAWTGGATTQNITGKAAGTYSVTITDAYGCTASASVTLTNPSPITLTTTQTNVNCYGASTGAINLSASGAGGLYLFSWSNGGILQNVSGLSAGTYTVTVTAILGGATATKSVTITQPAAALSGSTVNTNPTCAGGANGAVNLTPAGGTSPYTYAWSGGNGTAEDLTGKAAGTYTVTITDTRSCTATRAATLTAPAAISTTITPTGTTALAATNGAASLAVSGGTAPYTYLWSNNATTQSISNVGVGSYSVTVTDANGCSATAATGITSPQAVTGYTNFLTITIDEGRVYGNTDLTNFPFLISANSGILRSTTNGGAVRNVSGYDIVFTDADGEVLLDHQIESYNPATGQYLAWVRIPTLYALSNTEIRLYYGKAGVTANPSAATTFNSNYKGVYHLSTNSYVDATPRGNNAANSGSTNTTGKIAGANKFDGNDDYISIPYNADFAFNSSATFSAWVYGEKIKDVHSIMGKQYGTSTADNFQLQLNDEKPLFKSTCNVSATSQLDEKTWYYIVGTATPTARKLYVNGEQIAEVTTVACGTAMTTDNNPILIGAMENSSSGRNEFFKGTIDEARVSIAAHTGDWIKTEYYNQVDPAAGISIQNNTGISWEGDVSTAWLTAGNWAGNVIPTCADNVIIPAGTPYSPVISTGNAYCYDILVQTGATLSMSNGTLNICGDANFNSTINFTGGMVKFTGATDQHVYAGTMPTFYKMQMVNSSSSGLYLHKSVKVINQIDLTTGNVYTGTDSIILANSSHTSLTSFGVNSHVVGKLTRYIAKNTNTYIWPVGEGTPTRYFPFSLINKNLMGVTWISVYFTNLTRNDDNQLNVTDADITYMRICDEGMWTVEPNQQPTSGKYDAVCYIDNFTNLNDNDFGVLKRPKGGRTEDWGTYGGTKDPVGSITRLLSGLLGGGGSNNSGPGKGPSSTNGTATGGIYTCLKDLTAFSEFGVGGGGGSGMPIELLQFDGEYVEEQKAVRLFWSTEIEVNNDYFIVQRSEDGLNYIEVARVDGAGNSTNTLQYEAFDTKPLNGVAYYRLKQIDFDGKYSYSDAVAITVISNTSAANNFVVFPNPSNGIVTVKLTTKAKEISISVYDLSGRIAQTFAFTNNEEVFSQKLNLTDAQPAGQYFMRVKADNEEMVQKITVIE